MCQQGRTGAHVGAQNIRRQVGVPSVQFSPVILSNFTPVLTRLASEFERRVPLGTLMRRRYAARPTWTSVTAEWAGRPLERMSAHIGNDRSKVPHGYRRLPLVTSQAGVIRS